MKTAANIFGACKGTLGGVVLQKNFEKQIIKSKEITRNDSKSPAQLLQRSIYLFAASFFKTLTPALRLLYPPNRFKMNPFSFALSFAIKNSIETVSNTPFFSTHAIFRNTNLISYHPDFSSTFQEFFNSFSLTFSFTSDLLFDLFSLGDTLLIIIFNKTKATSNFCFLPISDSSFSKTLILPNTSETDNCFIYITSLNLLKLRTIPSLLTFQILSSEESSNEPATFDNSTITFDSTLFTFDQN